MSVLFQRNLTHERPEYADRILDPVCQVKREKPFAGRLTSRSTDRETRARLLTAGSGELRIRDQGRKGAPYERNELSPCRVRRH